MDQIVRIGEFTFSLPYSFNELRPVDFACNSEQVVFAEIFAGTAQLSDECRHSGFATLAIDKTDDRRPKIALTLMDLTKPEDIKRMIEVASTANIGAAHFAPACGTSSKAREKPLPSNMRHIKAEPLRSDSELLGLSTLSERERVRVQLANATYALTLLLVGILIRRGCIVSVENPSSSYFWPIMALYVSQCCGILLSWHKLESVHFQACMHGSDRDKWTCWYGTPNVFNSLALRCDGQHQHAQWHPSLPNGVVSFPTAQEASYLSANTL